MWTHETLLCWIEITLRRTVERCSSTKFRDTRKFSYFISDSHFWWSHSFANATCCCRPNRGPRRAHTQSGHQCRTQHWCIPPGYKLQVREAALLCSPRHKNKRLPHYARWRNSITQNNKQKNPFKVLNRIPIQKLKQKKTTTTNTNHILAPARLTNTDYDWTDFVPPPGTTASSFHHYFITS